MFSQVFTLLAWTRQAWGHVFAWRAVQWLCACEPALLGPRGTAPASSRWSLSLPPLTRHRAPAGARRVPEEGSWTQALIKMAWKTSTLTMNLGLHSLEDKSRKQYRNWLTGLYKWVYTLWGRACYFPYFCLTPRTVWPWPAAPWC